MAARMNRIKPFERRPPDRPQCRLKPSTWTRVLTCTPGKWQGPLGEAALEPTARCRRVTQGNLALPGPHFKRLRNCALLHIVLLREISGTSHGTVAPADLATMSVQSPFACFASSAAAETAVPHQAHVPA